MSINIVNMAYCQLWTLKIRYYMIIFITAVLLKTLEVVNILNSFYPLLSRSINSFDFLLSGNIVNYDLLNSCYILVILEARNRFTRFEFTIIDSLDIKLSFVSRNIQ